MTIPIVVPPAYLPNYITFPDNPDHGYLVIDPRSRTHYRYNAYLRAWTSITVDLNEGLVPVDQLPPMNAPRLEDVRLPEIREAREMAIRPEVEANVLDPAGNEVEAPRARTRAQQERWMILDAAEVHTRTFNALEAAEYSMLRYMAEYVPGEGEAPIPRRDRIRVSVVRTGETYDPWRIDVRVNGAAKSLPKPSVVREFLDQESKAYIPTARVRRASNQSILVQALNEGLSPQALHDALKAWVISTLSNGDSATSEGNLDDVTQHLLKVQPATLEVGGRVYKLVPAGSVDVRPLIARVRAKALSGAKVEATGLRNRAIEDSRMVVNQANDRAASIRREAQAELTRLRAMKRAPDWVVNNGLVHYWDGAYWNVKMKVGLKVTEIRLTVQDWGVTLYWNPISTLGLGDFGIPKNRLSVYFTLRDDTEGRFTMYEVHVKDQTSWHTVHINERACMELQGLPSRVTSMEEFNLLNDALTRGNRVINLSSPLSHSISMYHPVFKAQIPPIPLRFLKREVSFGGGPGRGVAAMEWFQREYPHITWDRFESIQQEAAGVFRLPEAEGENA